MRNILAFDVGTTAMKGILFNEKLEEVYCENREYTVDTSAGGTAEADAETYFTAFCECVEAVREKNLGEIAAICFTTQGETLIPIDKDGNALHRAIVWLDTRAGAQSEKILQKISVEDFYCHTGLGGIDGALPMAKVLWFKEEKPDLYEKTDKFLLLEDYLIFCLTGKTVSERSLQSSTGWYDILQNDWYEAMFDACGVDKAKFPEVLPCGETAGTVLPALAAKLGLSQSTVVVTGAMDQIASAIGAGNIYDGIVTETTGTALVLGATVSSPQFDTEKMLTVYKHFDDKFIYMPYAATAGIVLKWYRDVCMPDIAAAAKARGESSYDAVTAIAGTAPAGSNGVLLDPDFTSGGAFFNLTLATTRADMARSVLEGIAYMLRSLVEQVEAQGLYVQEILSQGGGSYSALWGNIKASICNKTICCVRYAQTTALGAAILAAAALGIYPSVEEAVATLSVRGSVYRPDLSDKAVYEDGYQKYIKMKKTEDE